uniref:glutamine--tRNA ligase n=1 Tax=Chromera velia CCMP2878 TaxID=1169474 RepID=A0A0G4HRR6_9ALVE|eukprot:Cvel_8110.t1-p1 / transcript=Cvel_8110.t1 / gene=Cvel_8110 / organism=Chromera_velia_CCMP2878 / gene_product=Glutamine--tRNA ligase, putative / transcript_product=Glutamine--tRNA ligase, putative / location=Cvel_scaffold441:22112-24016(-) / protein_length=635 / sequence_SO=supercontig / SO=protein_coding / is_pseudo=false
MSSEADASSNPSVAPLPSPAKEGGEEGMRNFIKRKMEKDLRDGTHSSIVTRFPPEPNGFLHLGHAKSICLNFGLAGEFGGRCHLRLDDTNPLREECRFIEGIKEDVRWLGFDWGVHLFFASDHFERLYEWAERLIKGGLAFVDDLSVEKLRALRGDRHTPGVESPFRDRSPEENLNLFRRMRAGEFPNGAKVLRAKIDMTHPNLHMRDPVMYRILHAEHPRTGNAWCIYPTYDFAHGASDSIEGVTHSVCTLEFCEHKKLYDWFLERLDIRRVEPIEFAKLNVTGMVLSKRMLMKLVNDGVVRGWDDPRLPTLRGLRRRGVPPAAIRDFCERVGVARRETRVNADLLEYCVRAKLEESAGRRLAVLDPLKVVILNYPADKTELVEVPNHPMIRKERVISFSREIFISREDFREDPEDKNFHRLAPGRVVRLRFSYLIECSGVKKNEEGEIEELSCTFRENIREEGDRATRWKAIHWVDARTAMRAEFRLYNNSLLTEDEEEEVDVLTHADSDSEEEGETGPSTVKFNPGSMEVVSGFCEPTAVIPYASPGTVYHFERVGFFCVDPDSRVPPEGLPVFNRTVGLSHSHHHLKGKESNVSKEAEREKREKKREEREKKRAAKKTREAEKKAVKEADP